jgi:hypothetical protein
MEHAAANQVLKQSWLSNLDNNKVVELIVKKKKFEEKFHNFPTLFHKYILKLKNPYDAIEYQILQAARKLDNKFIAHIHIFNLKNYREYLDIVKNLSKHFLIIITFVLNENENKRLDMFGSNVTFINCENKGADIGPKLSVLDFLFKNKVKYEYILFLHSKSNVEKRNVYFSFVNTEKKVDDVVNFLNKNKNAMAIYSRELFMNSALNKHLNEGTKIYIQEFLSLFELPAYDYFVEGNCILLNRSVIDFIFNDFLNFFYNLLNNYTNSFDLNWFRYKNNDFTSTSEQLYTRFIKEKLKGCDFVCSPKEQLRDCQIEHMFERIWLNVIIKLGGDFYGM